jgi:hypothetical protein
VVLKANEVRQVDGVLKENEVRQEDVVLKANEVRQEDVVLKENEVSKANEVSKELLEHGVRKVIKDRKDRKDHLQNHHNLLLATRWKTPQDETLKMRENKH